MIVAMFAFAFSYSQSDEPVGQKIFVENNCGKCHSVESLQIVSTGKKPVDLSNVGNKFNAEFLNKYLVKEEKVNDKNHPLNFKGNTEELNSLVEWLTQLKTE
jgi:hypothetical protein